MNGRDFMLLASGGWQVKDEEVLHSESPEKLFYLSGQIFEKGTFLVKKTLLSNVPSKSLLSVCGMKGCVSSGEYYPRQRSFGFFSQNQGVL